MEKRTNTHNIKLELGDWVDKVALVRQFTSLGLTLKPNQRRTCGGRDFLIQVETHWNYTPVSFFEEHLEFMDSFEEVKNRPEN